MQFNFSQGVGVKGGLAPSPVLTTVEGRLHTVAGEVRTKWELLLLPPEADQEDSKRTEEEGRSLPQAALEVSVPVGATDGATVVFPCVGKAAVITEAITGQVVWQNGGFVVAAASLPAAPQEEAAAAAGAGVIVSGVRVEHGGVALRVESGAR
jgi:predicted phage tail protein